jgi:NAD(P)-dependent dehydrogenase (short-subunit alcohol dehydrogenase family)
VAVVTASSKGIGLAITRALVGEGAQVVAGARNIDGLAGIDRVTPVAVDLGAPTARRSSASIGGFATGRFTTPEEVATLVLLLAAERTANVTGANYLANYLIDGGLI